MNRTLPVVLVGMLLFTVLTVGPVNGAEYSITVKKGSVDVRIALNFQQNLTLIDPAFTLPTLNSVLVGENSTVAAAAVESAIRLLFPRGSVEDFRMEVRSSFWAPETKFQSFNITLDFGVAGAAVNNGDVLLVDTSWKNFKVDEDIAIGGISINKIGEAYLADTAGRLADAQPPPGSPGGLTFHWEGLLVPAHGVRDVVSRIVTLDFSKLKTPLSEWEFSLFSEEASTDFVLSTEFKPILSITAEIPGEIQLEHFLFTHLNAEVQAEGFARPKGDLLIVDIGTGLQPFVMIAVILSALLLFVVSYSLERWMTRGYRRKKRVR